MRGSALERPRARAGARRACERECEARVRRRALKPDRTEGCARASASEAWRGELRADWREQHSAQLLAGRRGLGCTRGPARAEAANVRRRR